MGSELLKTKLYIPPPRSDIVPRPQLIERLNEGITCKLILVCAPAGFGKTTLISNWVKRIHLPVAWVSLEKGDNDRTSFLVYLVAALQTVEAGFCEAVHAMLLAPQPPPIESILKELINEVAALSREILLVLDDYQVIEDHAIDEALTFMLDHMPPVMHLVIISRSDPMLPLSRLRARSQMIEVRTENLRFSTDEATDFLNRVKGLVISEEDIAILETRTEGWIAGLHLAALSMQNKDNVAKFISEFAGDDRYIVDFLADEVLTQCPKGTRDFLLKTSILSRMTGSLCDAITGSGSGQEILERLEQANLFIVPLDSRRHWYRYHHLFADVLQQRLAETTHSLEIYKLHKRASQWYEENDFLIEAVEHALQSQDFDDVIRLVDRGSNEILMGGNQSKLLRWWNDLPLDLVASHPSFCTTVAWAWLSIGRPSKTEECLRLLEQSLGIKMVELFSERDQDEKIDPSVQNTLVEIAVMRIELASQAGNISQVFKLSHQVLPYLEDEGRPSQDKYLKNLCSVVFFVLGLAYKISGKLSEAGEVLSKAAELGKELGNVYIAAGSLGRLAGTRLLQGQLNQAMKTCQRGLKLVQQMVVEPPMSGLIHAELGNQLYEQNNLEAALRHLKEGIDMAKPWKFMEAIVPGYIGLARVRAAQGDWEGAFAALDELAALGEGNPTMVFPAVESLRSMLWVAQGKVEAANRLIMNSDLDPEGEIDFQQIGEWMVYVRVIIARCAYSEAVNLLTRMVDTAEASGWFGILIEMRVLLALANQMRGDSDQAMFALEQALRSAVPEGYMRVFLNEGEPMKALLHEAETRGIAPDYVPKLLATFETDHVQVETTSASALIEPLSERELEVLRQLKTELSGPEIASELVIALSTLRTHTQNIYTKLGVSNRREAVLKAEELNLR